MKMSTPHLSYSSSHIFYFLMKNLSIPFFDDELFHLFAVYHICRRRNKKFFLSHLSNKKDIIKFSIDSQFNLKCPFQSSSLFFLSLSCLLFISPFFLLSNVSICLSVNVCFIPSHRITPSTDISATSHIIEFLE